MLESVQEEEEKNIAVASTGRAKKYDDAAQPTFVMGMAHDSSGGTPSTTSMATATPSSTTLARSTVEAPPRPPPSAARTSGKLFIYFGLMQLIVVVTTIVSVQFYVTQKEMDFVKMNNKLEQIFAEREAREEVSRKMALQSVSQAASNSSLELKLTSQAQAARPPSNNKASATTTESVAAKPLVANAPSSAAAAVDEEGKKEGREKREKKGDWKRDRESKAAAGGHPWHIPRGSEGKYEKPKFKKVRPVPREAKGSWDDGYVDNGNCSGALLLPGGQELEEVLMPDVEPLIDPRVWLLNVGAGTTGTRTVQREICKRRLNSTHWHWHCNLPDDDSSVLAMEAWIEWLQPFYKITDGDKGAIEKANQGKVRNRPHHRVMMDALYGGLVSLGDTPVAFFPELVAWLPDTKVILTLRDAKKWWKSRVEHHAGDLMCAEHMWQQVAHPFSIADCFQLGGVQGLINIKNVDQRVGMEGYVRYNKWVMAVVPRERLFRHCPWDCRDDRCTEDGSNAFFVKQMLKFISDKCPPPCRGPPNDYPWSGTIKPGVHGGNKGKNSHPGGANHDKKK